MISKSIFLSAVTGTGYKFLILFFNFQELAAISTYRRCRCPPAFPRLPSPLRSPPQTADHARGCPMLSTIMPQCLSRFLRSSVPPLFRIRIPIGFALLDPDKRLQRLRQKEINKYLHLFLSSCVAHVKGLRGVKAFTGGWKIIWVFFHLNFLQILFMKRPGGRSGSALKVLSNEKKGGSCLESFDRYHYWFNLHFRNILSMF